MKLNEFGALALMTACSSDIQHAGSDLRTVLSETQEGRDLKAATRVCSNQSGKMAEAVVSQFGAELNIALRTIDSTLRNPSTSNIATADGILALSKAFLTECMSTALPEAGIVECQLTPSERHLRDINGEMTLSVTKGFSTENEAAFRNGLDPKNKAARFQTVDPLTDLRCAVDSNTFDAYLEKKSPIKKADVPFNFSY